MSSIINSINWKALGLPIILAQLLFISSCNEEIEPNVDFFGYEYYPLTVGDYRIYHTSTTYYNLDGSIDSAKYLVKEIAEESVLFTDGNTRIILGRYSKEINDLEWKKDSIWAVLMDDQKIVVSEANVDYVKLVFPVAEEKEWDGNATNAEQSEFYSIINLNKSYSYDTLTYENALTVVHNDLLDPAKITEDDVRFEVFAKDVGLIHKYRKKINYCSGCTENGKIDDGFIFEQKLIEFGQE